MCILGNERDQANQCCACFLTIISLRLGLDHVILLRGEVEVVLSTPAFLMICVMSVPYLLEKMRKFWRSCDKNITEWGQKKCEL